MDANKLQQIIDQKNERLEREAVYTAEEHIDQILKLNDVIESAKKAILEHQAALKALEVKTVDAKAIIGE